MIEAFKLTSGLYDTALSSLLEIQKNTRTRGHSKKLNTFLLLMLIVSLL
jgi:hypothetical protein